MESTPPNLMSGQLYSSCRSILQRRHCCGFFVIISKQLSRKTNNTCHYLLALHGLLFIALMASGEKLAAMQESHLYSIHRQLWHIMINSCFALTKITLSAQVNSFSYQQFLWLPTFNFAIMIQVLCSSKQDHRTRSLAYFWCCISRKISFR